MKTAVIYARYSSERQTEQSIEGQIRECTHYAQTHDILIVDTYIDRAMTGTNDNRSDFQRMLMDAVKSDWDIVLVYKLDRFSRNKYEMAIHKKALRDNGIQLVSAKEHIPEGPEGIILESLLEGMAEYYSVELAQKVSRGQKETRIKGNYSGGGIPYGYRVENKKIIVCEDRAQIVIRIFEMYTSGVIVRKIVEKLTEEGIMQANGKPFTLVIIYDMLHNERYTGKYTHKAEGVYTNIFPRIIPDHLFQAAQALTKAHKIGKNSLNVIFMLRNKMKCGYCGANMVGESGTSKTGKRMHYYKCGKKKKNRNNCSMSSPIRKDLLEKVIVDTTIKVLNNPDTVNYLVDKIFEAHGERVKDTSVLNILEANRNKIKKSLDNIMAAVEQGIITHTTKQRILELEAELDVAEAKVIAEKNKNNLQITRADVKKFIFKYLKKEPVYMIRALIKNIIIYNDKIEIYYNCIDSKRPDELDHQAFCFYEENLDLSVENSSSYNNTIDFKTVIKLYF